MAVTTTQDSLSGTGTTLLGLISDHQRRPARAIEELVRVGAAVQNERRRLGVTDVDALTRTTVLWAAAHLDDTIEKVLEQSGTSATHLLEQLSLRQAPEAAPVTDVAIHDDLARALNAYLAAESSVTIDVDDLAIAVLRDAQTNGGVLASRLAGADITGAITALLRRRPPPDVNVPDQNAAPRLLPAMTDATTLYFGFYAALTQHPLPRVERESDPEVPPMWSAFGAVASHSTGTMATIVVKVVLQLKGERSRGRSAAARAFDLPEGIEPVRIEEIERLEEDPLLLAADGVRAAVEPR